MATRVTVDPDLCIGSSDCIRALPRAFKLDEKTGVSVPQPEAATTDPAALVQAARNCPTQAILVTAEDGTILYGAH
jgi:ferredoxin